MQDDFDAEDAEGSYEPNHYQILGLDETASSRDIARAFLHSPYLFIGPKAVEAEARQREDAYSTLGDPVRRTAYDQQKGFTKDYIVGRIAKTASWGTTWAVIFGLLAGFFLLDHENMSRMIGSNFAPAFGEQRIYVDEEICKEDAVGRERCTWGYFEGKFHSSDSRWDWVLNSWLAMSLAPAALTAAVAFGGRVIIDRVAGSLIAWARFEGHGDTLVRWGLWAFVVIIPIGAWVLVGAYGLGVSTPYT